MKKSDELGPIERAQLRNFIEETDSLVKQNEELDRKETFKKLPFRKRLPVYMTKGLGLVLGVVLIIALIIGMTGGF